MKLKDRPPEGLVPWIREQKDIDWYDYLIYKHGWIRESITGLKEPCAQAVCSACGSTMYLEKAYSAQNLRGNASFGVGFWKDDHWHQYGSGERCRCPECGAEVTVLHSSAANNLTRYVWPMSFERDGKDLICYMWRAQRTVEKDGSVRFSAVPWEAYEFGEKTSIVHKKWYPTFYHGAFPSAEWETLSRFADRAFNIDLVYCPEGISAALEGTWFENSKLEIYMAVKGEYRFPLVWLKLFQRRKAKAETLMTCGAGRLVAGIIAEEKNAQSYYQQWTTKVDCLHGLDWSKKRPTEILRVNKEELSYFKKLCAMPDCTRRFMVLQAARKKGIRIRPGQEDGEWSIEEQIRLMEEGVIPAAARRYLEKQARRYKNDHGLRYLRDYWNMATALHMDLNDKEIRWPQNLQGMHDQLVERQELIKDKKREKDFFKRFERMSRYSWERDGILIRPAASAAELRKEGKALHHCVASYAERHAKGELTIFFIRRAGKPDEPWFTLNFNEKTLSVTENRGLRNCARTPEIQDFENAWLAWVRAGCKREKKREVSAA